MKDFFISYNKADECWAMGLGDWLDQEGYTTVFQHQDFVPATNFAAEMHDALKNTNRMIMVLSPDYLEAKFPLAEWTAAFVADPACKNGKLIPVRVRECRPDGLLCPIVYIDLVGLKVDDARMVFIDGIKSVLSRKRVKRAVRSTPLEEEVPKKATLTQKIVGNHNTNIQAERIGNLTIKSNSKRPLSIQPLDVVGANVEMRAYIEYLIERYIDWRNKGIEKGIDKRRFHPSMIHRDVKRDFGARTYLVPQARFKDLVHYLQVRINDTIIGRNNRQRNFHSFEEHLDILHGKKKAGILSSTLSRWDSAKIMAQANTCINNLRQLDGAKQQWALEIGKSAETTPDNKAIEAYLKNGILPKCPMGGVYQLNNIAQNPTCSIPGHQLPGPL